MIQAALVVVSLCCASSTPSPLKEAARQAWLLAYARGGDPAVARAKIAEIAGRPEDVRGLTAKLADLYADQGKDQASTLLWRGLIAEAPAAPEAALFQAQIVEAALRQGSRPNTTAEVRELVATFARVEAAHPNDPVVAAARELAERELSALAIGYHRERARDVEATDTMYGAYLTLFPDGPKAYALRFFWAEFLYDQLGAYERAAEQYTEVLLADVRTQEAGGAAGQYMEKAAYNAVLAREQVVAQMEVRRR